MLDIKIKIHLTVIVLLESINQLNKSRHRKASINNHFTHCTLVWEHQFSGKAGIDFTFMGTRLLSRYLVPQCGYTCGQETQDTGYLTCFTIKLRKALGKCYTTLDSYALNYPSWKR